MALALLFAAVPASAAPKQVINQIGVPSVGEAGGRFNSPRDVAVNQAGSGNVPAGTFYVVDSGNQRVQRFGPTGTFVSAWGWGVGGGAEYEVCTEASSCQKGRHNELEVGPVAGAFGAPRGIAVDQSTGNVYVLDPEANFGRIDVFGAKGDFQGAFGFGVLDGSGELQFCTLETGCVHPFAFPEVGDGGVFTEVPGEGVGGLAVDSSGNVYVADEAFSRVDVFDPLSVGPTVTDVEFLRSFGWGVLLGNPEFEVCTVSSECGPGIAGAGDGQFAEGFPSDVAVNASGDVFALDGGNERVQRFNSTPAVVDATFGDGALAAIFGGTPDLFALATDPSTTPNHLLVAGKRSGSGRVAVAELDDAGASVLPAGIAHGEDLTITSSGGLGVTQASLGGSLYVSTETVGLLRGAFVLGEAPTVEAPTEVTGSTATLHGRVVSNEIPVSYHFEYSVDGKTWVKAPPSDVSLAAQPGEVVVERKVTGLTGSQLYRLRLVQNRPEGGGLATSAEVTFLTPAEKPRIAGTNAWPIKDTSATLGAYLDPQNETTTYRFEYGLGDCSVPGACTPLSVGQESGGGARLVTQTVTGLQPGTLYHYRLTAVNGTGGEFGPVRAFETFASGRSLPDDRGYELVTPPDTGSVVLAGRGFGSAASAGNGSCFDTYPVDPTGDSVLSTSLGGAIPGLDANGIADLYESRRGPAGWTTSLRSPSGEESVHPGIALCSSQDHSYTTFVTGIAPADEGSLVQGGKASSYLGLPGGQFALAGMGAVGGVPVQDPEANTRWVSGDGAHAIFSSRVRLDDLAPAAGNEAIYDRPAGGGETSLLSLLPGGATPPNGANAQFQGASEDGTAVAFKFPAESLLLTRVGGTETVGVPDATIGQLLTCAGGPAGVSVKTFKWLRNGTPIGGATAATYTVAAEDAGKVLQCQVTATTANAGSTQTSVTSVIVSPFPATGIPPIPPSANLAAPTGTVSAGQKLTCNAGSAWLGVVNYTYQWYRNGVAIGSPTTTAATTSQYTLTAGDVATAAAYQCAVTANNASGSIVKVTPNKNSAPAPSPAAPVATATVASVAKTYAGLSESGGHLFYLQGGDAFSFDLATQLRERITSTGNAQFVNVSADGSHIYFSSTTAIAGSGLNGFGKGAQGGSFNLYEWHRGAANVQFIAVLSPTDVSGQVSLVQWTAAVGPGQNALRGRGNDPSRTTPDGATLLFESHANVVGYDSEGHNEIYRYEAGSKDLECVSCPEGNAVAQSDAELQVPSETPFSATNSLVHLQNVTDDGRTVFFQTEDALVPGDVNETWDVYEWKLGQQAYLISSGTSNLPSFLFSMTSDGSDVLFTSTERLVPQDLSSSSSIYDARVGGGFPVEASLPPCLPETCQGSPGVAPSSPPAGSSSFDGPPSKTKSRKHKKHKKHHKKKQKKHKHHKQQKKHQGKAAHNRGGVK